MLNRQPYANKLETAARQLTGDSSLPVDVAKICELLGVRVLTNENIPKAHIVSNKGVPEIRLPLPRTRRAVYDDPFSRYLIAHELGHFVLAKYHITSPLGAQEYWKYESLCDEFASLLLLPERTIASRVRSTPDTPQEHLKLFEALSKTGRIPRATTALSLARLRPWLRFFGLKLISHHQSEFMFRVIASTYVNKRGIRVRITEQHELGRKLVDLPTGKPLSIEPNLFESNKSLSFLKTSRAIAALRSNGQGVWLAVSLPEP